MILAQIVSFMFLLCLSQDASEYVCEPLTIVGFMPDDDNPTGLEVTEFINSVKGSSVIEFFTALGWHIAENVGDVLSSTIWVLPIMLLLYAEVCTCARMDPMEACVCVLYFITIKSGQDGYKSTRCLERSIQVHIRAHTLTGESW